MNPSATPLSRKVVVATFECQRLSAPTIARVRQSIANETPAGSGFRKLFVHASRVGASLETFRATRANSPACKFALGLAVCAWTEQARALLSRPLRLLSDDNRE